jgi:uncharacterized membrane protein YoaT (DUF817 family)
MAQAEEFLGENIRDAWSAPVLRAVARGDARLASWARAGGPVRRFTYEFVRFGCKQAAACVFGGTLLGLLIVTHYFYPVSAPLHRYDFLFLAALAIQAALLAFRFETWREFGVILVFHAVGMAMEIFKTRIGSWVYPEPAFFRIDGVPLFTGFMYSAIGSYMFRAWSLFDFRFTRHPPLWIVCALAAAIYANFFSHHFLPDARLALYAAAVAIFGRCTIHYRVHHSWRSMPILLAAFLAAIFIWLAENVGTQTSTWLYPDQLAHWKPVGPAKLGAWFLLQIVSYAMVAVAVGPRAVEQGPIARSQARHAARLADMA